ncbi:MAG: circadian clock KaiB family protein [Cyanobacteria bacterium P01_A01_bin.135]
MAQPAQMPPLSKGIALFTPGGDLVYCIDLHKQSRWHLHLCTALQDRLSLAAPPHFLVPCYTATVDKWQDPHSQEPVTVAEARPLVMQHRTLLSAVFDIDCGLWQTMPTAIDLCDPQLLTKYRQRFPQLWQYHNIVMQLSTLPVSTPEVSVAGMESGHLFILFIAGQPSQTEATLTHLHQALLQSPHPYTLKVVDVGKHPDQAADYHITVTPTLVRARPSPTKRLIGQITDVDRLVDWIKAT